MYIKRHTVRRGGREYAIARQTGLDTTVYSSGGKRFPGKLARQGPELLRWALFEAARCASRGGPNHDYYLAVKQPRDGRRAALSVARQLTRQVRHTLIALGDDVLAPVDLPAPTRQFTRGVTTSRCVCPYRRCVSCRGLLPQAPASTSSG